MSKIDKIIQIVSDHGGRIFGISESGTLYKYYPKRTEHCKLMDESWNLILEQPVVDNSACEVDERKGINRVDEMWKELDECVQSLDDPGGLKKHTNFKGAG